MQSGAWLSVCLCSPAFMGLTLDLITSHLCYLPLDVLGALQWTVITPGVDVCHMVLESTRLE